MKQHLSIPRGSAMRDGFTLIELLVVVAIIALLIGVLLPALGSAMGSARTLKCQANMRSMGTAAFGYGGDFRDAIPAFSWKPGNYTTRYDDLRNPPNDRVAVGHQAVSIIRDRTGFDVPPNNVGNWFANLWYTHLVYLDYLSANPEEAVAACPEDDEQIERFETPAEDFPISSLFRKFESSYETSSVTYTVDMPRGTLKPVEQHREVWATFNRDPVFLVQRRITEVQFASGKAYMFDTFDRHYAEQPDTLYFEPMARQPILFFDGSVSVRDTNDANPGFQPLDPTSGEPTLVGKPVGNAQTEFFPGYYRWTRGGLRGIDFGGNEINTGQPNP